MGFDPFYTSGSMVFTRLAGVKMDLADQFIIACLVATLICESHSGVYLVFNSFYCLGILVSIIYGKI